MKRKDLLEKSLVLEDLFNCRSISFYMKMDAALKFFEDAGMLPPPIKIINNGREVLANIDGKGPNQWSDDF